nr:DNA helicase [Tanacetum cinerariifolium]
MRFTQGNLSEAKKEEVSTFADWLLNVGDGIVSVPDELDPENTLLHPTAKGLQEKAIVCPKNDTADLINAKVISMLPGYTTTYTSHDEAMPHGHDGETLDRTLQDILNTPNKLFSGKSVMLGGDFRQTLPVKKKASHTEIIGSSIVQSYLWRSFKLFVLTEDMRFTQGNLSEAKKEEVSTFADWLLNVGDGIVSVPDELDPENTLLHPTAKGLQEKAIVCPKNDTADLINAKVISMLPGYTTTYTSHDEAMPHGHDGGETMEQASVTAIYQEDKGKNILTEAKITNISQLSATSYNTMIEAIAYRKWTSKTTKTKTSTKFCCILIDRQGTSVQANMGLRDVEYFDQLLQLKKAYRFIGFSCEPTDSWERTLPTEITLIFGRYLQAEEIATTDFPEHYFNFAAYNELSDRLAAKNPILTGRQLSATSATHYYFNPSIPETQLIRKQGPVLQIIDHRYEDMEQEKLRNQFPLAILHDIDLLDYQKLLSILSAHKSVGIMKSAPHVDRNLKKSNPFQNARTMDHKQLKLTVLALPPPSPTQTPEPYVITESHHTSPEAGSPDLPEPPKPHTPPTTISEPTIIETNIITSEHEPINKEGTHKQLPKASTRKALFEHQPETDPTEVSKKHKKDP